MSIEPIYDLIDRREFDKVKGLVESLLKLTSPQEIEYINFLTLIETGKFEGLESDLSKFESVYSSNFNDFDTFRVLLLRADIFFKHYDIGNWNKYLTQADSLIENITPKTFLNRWWLGHFYLRKARANFINGQSVEALSSLNQGLVHIKSIDSQILHAKAQLLMGSIFKALGRHEEGIDALKYSISLLPADVNLREKAYARINLCGIRVAMGDFTKALDEINIAKKLATDSKDFQTLATVLFDLSHIYMLRYEFSTVISLLEEGLSLAREHDLKADEIYFLIKKAELMDKMNLTEKGVETINTALNLINTQNMTHEVPLALLVLGNLHFSNANYDKAIEQFKNAYKLYTEHNNQTNATRILNEIGKCHEAMGHYDDAKEYYSQQLTSGRSSKDLNSVLLAKINLARLEYKRGGLESAKKILTDSLKEAESLNSTKFKAVILHDLSEIERLKGEYDVALKLNKESKTLFGKIGNKRQLQELYYLSGKILGDFGQYEEMFEDFNVSEALAYETQDYVHLGRLWFEEVVWFVQSGRLEEGIRKLQELKDLSNDFKSPKLTIYSNSASAFVAKHSKEGYEFFQAKHQFIKLSQIQTLNFDLKVFILMNLAQILLHEWQLFKNEVVLEEINSILNNLQNLSTLYHNPTLKINLFILSLHVSLLNNDFHKANAILKKASNVAESLANPVLIELVGREEKEFSDYVMMMKKLGEDVAPFEEERHMDLISDYIEKVLKSQNRFTRGLSIVQDDTDNLEETS